jgi:hypothetical protein
MNNPQGQRGCILFWLLSVLLSCSALGYGQGHPPERQKNFDARPPTSRPEGPSDRRQPGDWGRRPGAGMRLPAFDMFLESKVVKGAPYSATVITDTVQTLANGARITNTKTDTVYRDSEGRTRREQQFDRIGPFSLGDQPQQIVFINDVVTGTRILLDPARRTARKLTGMGEPPPRFMLRPPASQETKTEALGKQVIEGIEAEGTRTTVTIPVGRIGNDRPLEIISERWEAPALQIVLLSKHVDPLAGETTYRLTNLKRAEQPQALFEIPTDYTSEEEPPRPPNWRGRRRGQPE